MKDPVVAFGLWGESTFLLQEDSNVTLTPLTSHTLPPPPLITNPQIDGDCGNEAAALLILPSDPCVVIIATTSGMLQHCVHLSDETETVSYYLLGAINFYNLGLIFRLELMAMALQRIACT